MAKAPPKVPPRGLTRRGYNYYRHGGALALSESRPGALSRQARRELATAYKPVYKGLNTQRARAQALDAKRASDEAAFKAWLTDTQNSLLSRQKADNLELRGQSTQHQQDLLTTLGAIPGSHVNAGGEGGGPAAAVNVAQQAALRAGEGSIQDLLARQAAGTDLASATAENNLGIASSLTAKRAGETSATLSAIEDARSKARLQQAGQQHTRLAQLRQNEIQKAQLRIAAQQFQTKEVNDLLTSQASNKQSAANAWLRHTDAAAGRAQKSIKADSDFILKYGVDKSVYLSWPQARRVKFMRTFHQKGTADKDHHGIPAAKIGRGGQNLAAWANWARRQNGPPPPGASMRPDPKDPKKGLQTPIPKRRPGHSYGHDISVWLQRDYGLPPGLANVVAGHVALNKNFKWTKKSKQDWIDYVNSLPG